MANINTVKSALAKKKEGGVGSAGSSIKSLMDSPVVKKRFEEVLGKKSPQFMSSIVNLVNGDTNLKKVDQMSVVASAMVAATLDLPIDKNLGYAWVVPYGDKAQFQIGYKGYVQLALRTGQYKSINVVEIHEGELISWNPLTEALDVDFEKKESDAIIGYAGYFELINGFKKTVYWTKAQIEAHKRKFSKSGFGWQKDYDAMAKKTVLKNMLNKWGILSIEMQQAVKTDSSVVKEDYIKNPDDDSNIQYVEATFDEALSRELDQELVDAETGEVLVDDVASAT